jgi:hypothetical protein
VALPHGGKPHLIPNFALQFCGGEGHCILCDKFPARAALDLNFTRLAVDYLRNDPINLAAVKGARRKLEQRPRESEHNRLILRMLNDRQGFVIGVLDEGRDAGAGPADHSGDLGCVGDIGRDEHRRTIAEEGHLASSPAHEGDDAALDGGKDAINIAV